MTTATTKLTDHLAAFRNGDRPVTLVAFGDSVTMGYTASGVIEHENTYHARVRRMLHQAYPMLVVNAINAGVAGGQAPSGLKRFDRDVLCHRPDILLIAFGLNDAHRYQEGMQAFKDTLTEFITLARAAGTRWPVLITPPFMANADNIRVSDTDRRHVPAILKATHSGSLDTYAQAVRDIGAQTSTPVADVHARWTALAKSGVDTNTLLSNGLNHPTGEAHKIHADAVFETLMSL
jgi:acyl-CoA thioesterase I